jgi:hypothetical protein
MILIQNIMRMEVVENIFQEILKLLCKEKDLRLAKFLQWKLILKVNK